MNLKSIIADANIYASARTFNSSEEANTFLGSNPEYKVVPNPNGAPSTQVTLALKNDEGTEA